MCVFNRIVFAGCLPKLFNNNKHVYSSEVARGVYLDVLPNDRGREFEDVRSCFQVTFVVFSHS
jgi:hypothetical protein